MTDAAPGVIVHLAAQAGERYSLNNLWSCVEANPVGTVNMAEIQTGDVPGTWASLDLLQHLTGYRPDTPVCDGTAKVVAWSRNYYQVWRVRSEF